MLLCRLSARLTEGVLEYNEALPVLSALSANGYDECRCLKFRCPGSYEPGESFRSPGLFRKVLESDSTDFYANYQLARLYSQIGDYENAVLQFNVLRDQDTTKVNPVIYRNIADCYMKMNAIPAATICYFQAYNVNRENAGLASALVNCLYRMGGPEIYRTDYPFVIRRCFIILKSCVASQ